MDRGHFFHYGRDNGRSNASAELSWHSEIPAGEAAWGADESRRAFRGANCLPVLIVLHGAT